MVKKKRKEKKISTRKWVCRKVGPSKSITGKMTQGGIDCQLKGKKGVGKGAFFRNDGSVLTANLKNCRSKRKGSPFRECKS